MAPFGMWDAPDYPRQLIPRIPMATAVADMTKDLKETQVWMTSDSREVKVFIGLLSYLPADMCADT